MNAQTSQTTLIPVFDEIESDELQNELKVDVQRELDITKSKVFLGENAAFLGTLMSSMNFVWSRSIPTAATNGETFWWNPDFFLSLEAETRKTVLIHELWHAGLLHMLRRGDRDPYLWNVACDYRINNGLEDDGYSFKGVESCCKDQSYGLQAEEDIYDQLMQKQPTPKPMWGPGPCTPNGMGGSGQQNPMPGDPSNPGQYTDMIPCSKESNSAAVNNVVRAIHQAKKAGQPGSIPGGLEEYIEDFLKPIVPWEQLLHKWMRDLLDTKYTMARPRRRYIHSGIYLPERVPEEGRLEHLCFYQDTSGSMSQEELQRTNSEIKYIWDSMQPKKLTTVQFDTKIHKIDEFNEGDRYERMVVMGRGGTDLKEVRQHIIDNRPTAVVIFTDLYVDPMEDLPFNVPVLWITHTTDIQPPFGDVVIMQE